VAELAARDRQTGRGHREAAGARITHRLHDASRTKATSPAPRALGGMRVRSCDGPIRAGRYRRCCRRGR
jgi:hypothetical protein